MVLSIWIVIVVCFCFSWGCMPPPPLESSYQRRTFLPSSSSSSWVFLALKLCLSSATPRSHHKEIKLLKVVAVSCLLLGSCWRGKCVCVGGCRSPVLCRAMALTGSLTVINRKIAQVEWFKELKIAQTLLKASPYLHSCEKERSCSENEFGPRARCFLSLRLQPAHAAASQDRQSKSHFQVRWGRRALCFLRNRSLALIYCVCNRAFVRLGELLLSLSDNCVQNVK